MTSSTVNCILLEKKYNFVKTEGAEDGKGVLRNILCHNQVSHRWRFSVLIKLLFKLKKKT